MKFDEFKQTVIKVMEHTTAMNTYIEMLPSDLTNIWDNVYANNQGMLNDYLIDKVFGNMLMDPMGWLLYEWKPNTGMKLEDSKGTEYTIDTLDDFFNFMSANYVW